MNNNNTLWIVLLLLTQLAFGQNDSERLIHGIIIVDSTKTAGIAVVNLVNEKSTITNNKGEFFILAKADDVLVFSGIDMEFKRKLIKAEDLKLTIIIVNMNHRVTELEEVVVHQHHEINAVSLGIIPKGQKSYTAAERGRYSQPRGILDAMKIMITGKNPARDQAIKFEKNIKLLKKIENLFEEKYYTETLKIPADYIKGFQYYCIENLPLVKALKSKNKSMTMFLIITLAKNYNEMLACEQE